jgi:hypothetical protein
MNPPPESDQTKSQDVPQQSSPKNKRKKVTTIILSFSNVSLTVFLLGAKECFPHF